MTTQSSLEMARVAPAQTRGFRLNHSMIRVKDPQVALAFYTETLGMTLVRRLDFEEMQFSLYFLAFLPADAQVPADEGERTRWVFSQTGILELTHNWGTENDEAFRYHDGNAQPQGFGHLCISVDDLQKAVQWFDERNVPFVKRPDAGKMKDVAFIKDPDGYWIEVIQPDLLGNLGRKTNAA